MSASLVGSEMCIRDSVSAPMGRPRQSCPRTRQGRADFSKSGATFIEAPCLLYTSDAADDM
eukprot:5012626-Alexandrium_andersonii.AAC.1